MVYPLNVAMILFAVAKKIFKKKRFPSFQERESELALIRNRFQKGNNMWKNKDETAETNKNTDIKVGQQAAGTQKQQKCLTSHKIVTFS